MPELEVRRATVEDAHAIERFATQILARHRRRGGPAYASGVLAPAFRVGSTSADVIVAHDEGLRAVGVLEPAGPTHTHARFALLAHDEAAAVALLDAAARLPGVDEYVEVDVLPGDQPVKSALESAGFRAHRISMRRPT